MLTSLLINIIATLAALPALVMACWSIVKLHDLRQPPARKRIGRDARGRFMRID